MQKQLNTKKADATNLGDSTLCGCRVKYFLRFKMNDFCHIKTDTNKLRKLTITGIGTILYREFTFCINTLYLNTYTLLHQRLYTCM